MNSRIRWFAVVYLLVAFVSYVALAMAGFFLSAPPGEALTATQSVQALDFAFADEVPEADWRDVEGNAHHDWLTRRAFVRGSSGPDQSVYSEQVLKVGWPFTTVRGFVRTMAGTNGARTAGLAGSDHQQSGHHAVGAGRNSALASPVRLIASCWIPFTGLPSLSFLP